ncbi:MAG: hypothetical protein ACXWVR_07255, partial [Rhodoplanes sp.]
ATLSLMDHTPESVTLIGIVPQSMELGTELTPQIDAAADEALVKVLEQLAALGVRAVEWSGRARPMPCV